MALEVGSRLLVTVAVAGIVAGNAVVKLVDLAGVNTALDKLSLIHI